MTTQKNPPVTTPYEPGTNQRNPQPGQIDKKEPYIEEEGEEIDYDTPENHPTNANNPSKHPFDPEKDPEIDPQRIDPNETEENPNKQRERERNPEKEEKPKP